MDDLNNLIINKLDSMEKKIDSHREMLAKTQSDVGCLLLTAHSPSTCNELMNLKLIVADIDKERQQFRGSLVTIRWIMYLIGFIAGLAPFIARLL